MGWLFGPVGGLLGAGIGAIVSKRRRDGIAAYAQADAETTEATLARGMSTLDNAAKNAAGDESALAEIAMIREQAEQYAELTSHPDAQTRGAALVKFAETTGTLDGELEELEARRVEATTRERGIFKDEVGQYNTLQDDLRALSGDFLGKQRSWQVIQELGQEQNAANDTALAFALLKMYDPASTVLPSEQANVTNAGGLDAAFRAQYNKFITGEGQLDPKMRSDFIRQAANLYGNSLTTQKEIESDFMNKGRATGLRPELVKEIGFSKPFEGPSFAELTRAPPISAPAESSGNLVPVEESLLSRAAQQAAIEAKEIGEGIGRQGRGETLMTDGSGKFFVVDAEGNNLGEVDAPNDYVPDIPDIFGSPADRDRRRRELEERQRNRPPGLFQPGGFFRRDEERETND